VRPLLWYCSPDIGKGIPPVKLHSNNPQFYYGDACGRTQPHPQWLLFNSLYNIGIIRQNTTWYSPSVNIKAQRHSNSNNESSLFFIADCIRRKPVQETTITELEGHSLNMAQWQQQQPLTVICWPAPVHYHTYDITRKLLRNPSTTLLVNLAVTKYGKKLCNSAITFIIHSLTHKHKLTRSYSLLRHNNVFPLSQ